MPLYTLIDYLVQNEVCAAPWMTHHTTSEASCGS